MKKFLLLCFSLIILCCWWLRAQAAAPAMHVYLAEEFIQNYKVSASDHSAFIVGTLYPDIRYAADIPRAQTHEHNVSLQDICLVSNDYFNAGKKFHSYVDEKRERFAYRSHIYDVIKPVPIEYRATYLKLLEDEIIWDHVDRMDVILNLFHFSPDEKMATINEWDIFKWHVWLMLYFQHRPSEHLMSLAQDHKGWQNIPAEVIANWAVQLPAQVKDERIKKYVNQLTTYFQTQFELACGKPAL